MEDGEPSNSGARRLPAIDVARGVALLGMMAAHVLSPGNGPAGALHNLVAGRSAALFAVLAGVGLALGSGGAHPTAERLRWARRAIPIRAAVIGVLGLTLGLVSTPLAIILVYYAVLFLFALPVLGWSARRLAVAAAVWALLSPVLSQLLRAAGLNNGPGPNPSWLDVVNPGTTVLHLLLTGYYPVLTWVTYLLAGLAVGRSVLGRATGARLAWLGAALAVGAALVASVCIHLAGGAAALEATTDPSADVASFYGVTPTSSWWFLGVRAPHSGAIPDLVHTTGTSLLGIGLALLLVPRTGGWLRPLAAAGSMTLTLYAAHAVALGRLQAGYPDDGWPVWPVLFVNVVLALAIATLWGSPTRRGPLEELVATSVQVGAPR